ncbi:hypothetical protein EI77_00783 [Prosthecobacter fusiformis]|uniref:Uncharacterized protein n=1 Tax=Prosthecobacter fusiformis TaxID=48464 RepID=A0A4R7SR92_9BACT|nr:hypothetical protein [Prosthecobacter fusiformis]TDU81474.1 hypothetical protein EI77_00783 [Prosthecobacter fusiformis]
MFQPATDPQGQEMADMPTGMNGSSPHAMNGSSGNFQAPSLNSAVPFGNGGALFRTVAGESFQAAAVQASPFTAQGAAPASPALTVGDVLPQLPPDMVRLNALSPEQPVAVSPQVLDAALRSGQAALPIFEIYRVCPALFQAPVSPQDPRMVPLPASKLPRLIASAQQAGGQAAPAASPFGSVQPQQAASPFAAASPGQGGTALPPRRNGPPPPLADIPRETPALSLPGAGHPVFPVSSPFAAVAPAGRAPETAATSSPFGVKSAEPQPPAQMASPFSAAQPVPAAMPAPASPFSVLGGAPSAETPASPFAPFTVAAPAPAPAQPAPVESPFASLFGPKAVPTGQPAPDVPARPFGMQPSPPAMAGISMAPSAAAGGSTLRIGLAALLRGYSVAELGFDPIMVPSWIMTSQPASTVREWAQSPAPLAELGKLIDGITDVGFRNVLNHAKRDFQLRIPQEEIHAALNGESPPTLPNLASLGQPELSAPVMMTTSMTPPAQGNPSPFAFTPPAQPEAPPAAPQPAPSFSNGGTPAGMTPSVPLFASALAPAQATIASPMAAFPASSPPLMNPFAVPAAPQPPAYSPPVSMPEVSSPGQPFVSQSPAPAPRQASFPQPPADGFSSAQLLGAQPSDGYGAVPPAPAIPVTNPFTGKTATHIVDVAEEAAPPPLPEPVPERAPPPPVARTASPFIPPSSEETVRSRPAPASAPAPSRPAPTGKAATPALGIQSHDSNPDQILLRALLGTDDDLSPQRIVEMVCSLPGIAACVCLQGDRAFSHVGAHKPQAREFQKQATDLAHHLRTLAPLIGIADAETFTLTSGDRLMTFCFPEGAILGVLHDADPSLGLRDKITLIARELSRMLG